MLTLVCSAAARKRYNLHLENTAPEVQWHEGWRLDMLRDAPCGYGAMVTNFETLFTILVPARECATFNRLLDHFRMRLQFTLIDTGSSVRVDSALHASCPAIPGG